MAQGTFYCGLNDAGIAGVLSVSGKRISAIIRWTIFDIGMLDAVIDSEFSKAI